MSKRKKPYNYIIVTDNNLVDIVDKISRKSTITDDADGVYKVDIQGMINSSSYCIEKIYIKEIIDVLSVAKTLDHNHIIYDITNPQIIQVLNDLNNNLNPTSTETDYNNLHMDNHEIWAIYCISYSNDKLGCWVATPKNPRLPRKKPSKSK